MNVPWVTDRAANEVTVSWDEPSSEYSISKYRVEYKKIINNVSTKSKCVFVVLWI